MKANRCGAPGVAVLKGLDRGLCTGCNSLRWMWGKQCWTCGIVAPPRLPRADDKVEAPVKSRVVTEKHPGAEHSNFLMLPQNWQARVQGLPCSTIVHTPSRLRERAATAMAQGLEDLLTGGLLELGRARLLYAAVPAGLHRNAELELRFSLWQTGQLETLLCRIEEQCRAADTCRVGLRADAAMRARALTREGAYSKAVSSLTSNVASLTAEEQHHWATKLLPCSSTGEAICPPPAMTPVSLQPQSDHTDEHRKAGYGTLRKRALGGVKFPARSAPGPTGARPEHLQEALLAHRRHATGRLLRALADLARRGHLPASAHWLTQSRVVFLCKKNSTTPRPIRVGELWRRIICKRAIAEVRDKLQTILVGHRQAGVSLPGGADTLIHARRILESVGDSDEDAATIMLDLDLRNAFPSLEWGAIRRALASHCPELLDWVRWTHQAESQIQLPDDSWIGVNRGAEQGDPLGPVFCGLVLIDVARAAELAALRAQEHPTSSMAQPMEVSDAAPSLECPQPAAAAPEVQPWALDLWFMDDGQVVLPALPGVAAAYLSTFDHELKLVGGTRAAEDECKSTVRLLGSPEAKAAVNFDWMAEVQGSCKVLERPADRVLGIGIDGGDASA